MVKSQAVKYKDVYAMPGSPLYKYLEAGDTVKAELRYIQLKMNDQQEHEDAAPRRRDKA